jgi:hypothetical protein
MAAKRKPRPAARNRRASGPASNESRSSAAPKDPVAEAEELLRAERGEHESDEAPAIEVEGAVDAERLRSAIADAVRARDLARRRENDHIKAKDDFDRRDQALADRAKELDEQRADVTNQASAIEERETELAEQRKQLHERQRELFDLEQAARSDFAEYRNEQLTQLRAELDRRRAELDEELESQADAAAARQAASAHAIGERAAALDAHAAELDQRERDIERKRRDLTAHEQYLQQDLADQAKAEEARFAAKLEGLQQELASWRQRYEATRRLAEQRAAELAEREAADLAFTHRSATEIAAELEQLRQQNAQLRGELASNAPAMQDRLLELEARNQDLAVEREELLRQNEELRRHLAANRISVLERENSRVVNQALERLNGTLRTEIEEHTARLAQLQAATAADSAFPACSGMDAEPEYWNEPELVAGVPSLRQLVARVRARIASTQRLYYSERDLRCFLGGLAASRLHLLQGISGIGKTRLPSAFAAAIGAQCETVAVAAEWRSPQDLMGYYNAFERRFYESEFTQALYRAQLPLFAKKPCFVVLDEMNLSHPEQYFSDVLSAMERVDNERVALRLMTSRVDPAPRLLIDGRDLALPTNVWFVGTANHDETTVSFADKTYDRAHVLELPPKPIPLASEETHPLAPVSFESLTAAFDRAEREHRDTVQEALDFIEIEFGDRRRRDFRVSWGSRVQRQAGSFIPVVMAAGGEIGEATDHLLATKVLRKLQGRVEVPPTELEALRTSIDNSWSQLCTKTKPEESLRVLEDEIRFRGAS